MITNRGLSDPELGVVGYNHVLLLGPGSDWRSGVLGRRQSLRQGCRRQALQEAVAGGRQRSFDTFRRNRDYPGLDGIITASVCPLDGVKVRKRGVQSEQAVRGYRGTRDMAESAELTWGDRCWSRSYS